MTRHSRSAPLVWGRPFRPFALAVTIESTALAGLIFTGSSLYGFDDAWARAIGIVTVIVPPLLLLGFALNNRILLEHGYLLASGVAVARTTYFVLTGASHWASLYVSAWAVGCAGAWWVERRSDGGPDV